MDADLFAVSDPAVPAREAWWHRPWRLLRALDTLKARVTLGALVALLAGIVLTGVQMSRLAERDLLQQARQREQYEARQAATAIGHSVLDIQHALQAVADQLDSQTLDDPQRLATFFEHHPVLRLMVSNVFAADAAGRMLILVDGAGARFPTTSLADRAYFQRTLRERRAVVSDAIPGRVSNEPVVILTAPLLRDGVVIGVIGGGMRLASRDLLNDLAAASGIDDKHALVAVSDVAGNILAHPERDRLLQAVADDPRLTPAAADGPDIVAMADEPVTGWHVWRAVSRQQLLAPLLRARTQALQFGAVLALALAALLALYLQWQLRPLQRLERRAAALLAGDSGAEWPVASGEIGQLARTLRHVWAERTQVESFNAQVLQKLGSVMAAAPVGLGFTRHQRFELVSDELCLMLRRPEHELVGQLTQVIFLSNEDYLALGPQVVAAFERGQSYAGEWQLLRADGSSFWSLLQARPVDVDDRSAGTIWSLNDISDQVSSRHVLEHAAHHDALTGVVNRKGFDLALRAMFDARPGSLPAALVMIDLDHFKPINDSAGHAAGDAMLVAVAQAITSRVRTTDLVVRLGGDEFALLLPHCDHERALVVAEKVRAAITGLALSWDSRTLRVGASLGVAELGDSHRDPAEWLAQADAACYAAKRDGRGSVRSARASLRVV